MKRGRYQAIHAVKELFDAVVKVLQDIEEEHSKAGADAAVVEININIFIFRYDSMPGCMLSTYSQSTCRRRLLHTHELGHAQNLFCPL